MTSDPSASMTINAAPAAGGQSSDPILLDEGANLITITVTAEDGVTSASYSVDVTRSASTGLSNRAYVKALNNGAGDLFGSSVAMSADTFVIGSPGEDSAASGTDGDAFDNSAGDAGAAYVFHKDAAGTWAEAAYIKATNSGAGDGFGNSLALSGDTLAIGASREDSAAMGVDGDGSDNSAVDAGAVYIFTRDATGIWSQQAYIKASNTEPGDHFGTAVALDGDTLVVGAYSEDSSATGVDGDQLDNGGPNSGAVYVFTRDGAGVWAQQAYLKASNADADDQFGSAVALSGNTVAVGAFNEASKSKGVDSDESNNSWTGTGAVYVFTRDAAGTWSQQAYIKASNTGSGDYFGATVALSYDTLVVGAPREDSAAVGVNGFEGDNKALNAGASYVFVRDGAGTWSQQAYLKASNTDAQDQFGIAAAIHGNFVAVAALEDSSATSAGGNQADNSARDSGAVYLFSRDTTGAWSQAGYLKASNTGVGDSFGAAVSIGEYGMVVGATLEDSAATGIGGDETDDTSTDSGAAYLID